MNDRRIILYARWTPAVAVVPEKPAEPKEEETEVPTKPSYNRPPAIITITPVEPTEETPEETPEEIPADENNKKGSLTVSVVTSTIEGNETQEDNSSVIVDAPDKILNARFEDKEKVAEIVLNEAEWKKFEQGSDIEIRLKVESRTEERSDEALKSVMEQLLQREIAIRQQKNADEDVSKLQVVVKSFVNLQLEKRIDLQDWERIKESGEEIKVVITIPENLRKDGEKLYLAKSDGSGYILIEDLDDDPDTITISTADFDSEYVLLSILEEEAPLAFLGTNGEFGCWWHWWILVTFLVYLLLILLAAKRKREDEDEEEEKRESLRRSKDAEAVEEELDDVEKRLKRSRRRRVESQLLLLLILIIINILGFCWIELPASIVTMLLLSLEQTWSYRHKFKKEREDIKEYKQMHKEMK